MAPTTADQPSGTEARGPRSAHVPTTVGAACARIGPNAILRVAEALIDRVGPMAAQQLFARSGLMHHLLHPPRAMVDELDVAWLHRQLRTDLDPNLSRDVLWDAGTRTGDYLLEHRIPRPAQFVLRRLPTPLAARVLAQAIAKHAWTFAGSGAFRYSPGRPFVLSIRHGPLCGPICASTPTCHYYCATFERIFRALVSRHARVTEVACEAAGGDACVFEVAW